MEEEVTRPEFEELRNQVDRIDMHGSKSLLNLLKQHHDKAVFWSIVVIVACFIAFAALNAWFVLWDVSSAQHVWCHVLTTITSAPAPVNKEPGPSRAYTFELARDFIELKKDLGCS